jgi:transposase
MSRKLSVPSKEELETYYNQVKSISKTSKRFKTSNPTVRKWLKHYSIYIYSQREAVVQDFAIKKVDIPTKEELLFLYEHVSISDIRKMYNIGQETFYDWLDQHNIQKLALSHKVKIAKHNKFNQRFQLTKEQIEEDYSKIQCMGGLADHYNCSMTTIKKLFKLHNIEARFAKSSIGQLQVAKYIESLGFTVILNDRKLIAPLELDIVISEKNIAIEYCGIYYHSETWGNKDKNYHLNKHNLCREKNYKLITIFENEWFNKQDIVKSILSVKLGKNTTKVPARKTIFKELSYKDIKKFEIENHLQGTRPANKYYGLYYQNELVMSLSIGKSRFNKNISNEIVRMTTKRNTIITGGISKFVKNIGINDCLTYADKRYGDGNGYKQVGFIKLNDSSPNYFYFHKKDHDVLYSRNKFQKHKIANIDTSMTEYENMLNQNYDRIWDCGNSVYYLK